MQLADKPVLQSYHQLDYDWTPLSQNPCCVTADCVITLLGLFHVTLVGSSNQYMSWPCAITTLVLPGKHILCRWLCFGTRHCKHESSPCATICWGLTCASTIFSLTHSSHPHHITLHTTLHTPYTHTALNHTCPDVCSNTYYILPTLFLSHTHTLTLIHHY